MSAFEVLNFVVPIYRHSGFHDAELKIVASTLKSSVLFKRLMTMKTVELAKPDAYYRNLMALHKNVTRKMKERHYGTVAKPADTFAKCKSPAEVFHLKRRVETNIANTMHRFGFAIDTENKPMLHGKDFPDIPMFMKYVMERKIAGRTTIASFRLLESFISVQEWYKKGVEIDALEKKKIRPIFSVWSPTSQDYINLLAKYLDAVHYTGTALDIGTGTGVLSLLLASKGLTVTAIDNNKAAIDCARVNVAATGIDGVDVKLGDITQQLDLPRYKVIVANPPWLPGLGDSLLGQAIFDHKGAMIKGCFRTAKERLESDGSFLLLYCDLACNLGLLPADYIQSLCSEYGLRVHTQSSVPLPVQTNPLDPLKPYKDQSHIILYDLRPS